MAKIGGGKPMSSPAAKLKAGLSSAQKQAKQKAESDEVEEALFAWAHMQGGENTRRLYNAAITYFGIKPVIPD